MSRNSARVVRQTPVSERIKSLLNPLDLLLYVYEELNSQDWDGFDKQWSTILGVGLNLTFIFARINSTVASNGDDIFEDYRRRPNNWLVSFCSFVTHFLILLSVVNAVYTLLRTKAYRLLHVDVNRAPGTPSARLVKIDSDPVSSSPLGFLSNVIVPATAESRAHVDETEDIWELSVWDPLPVCLRLFVLFSPGHVLIVMLFLPYSALDPRPSVTVAKTMLLCALLSLQSHFLQKRYSQQSKDNTTIYREADKEYNSKFVQPNSRREPVRDVGTQAPHMRPIWDEKAHQWTPVPEVVSGKPYISPRAFKVHPNTSYASYYDLSTRNEPDTKRRFVTPSFVSHTHLSTSDSVSLSDVSSPIRPPASTKPFPSPQRPTYSSTASGSGDGGSLGVYTHSASPLRKAASANLLRQTGAGEVRRREGSPLKRSSTPASGIHQRLVNPRDGDYSRRDSGRY